MSVREPRVLLVDDDATFARAVARWLRDLGCSITEVKDCREGQEALAREPHDVLFLDLGLPDASGHALLAQLRRSGVDVPVVMMSGTAEIADVVRAWRADATDFLRKPFSFDELSAALDKAVRRATAASEVPLAAASAARAPSAATDDADLRTVPLAPSPVSGHPGVRPHVSRLIEDLKASRVRLPMLDPTLAALPPLLARKDWTKQQVTALISRDSMLAAAVLRRANSSAFGTSAPIKDLDSACVRLGAQGLIAVAFEVSLLDRFPKLRPPLAVVMKSSWECSVLASTLAHTIASRTRNVAADEARVVTLFHNVGELLAIQLVAQAENQSGTPASLEECARECSATHELLGQALTSSWGLPSEVVRIAGRHHASHPHESPAEASLRNLVLAAWALALRAGKQYLPGQQTIDPQPFLTEIGLSIEQIEQIMPPIAARR